MVRCPGRRFVGGSVSRDNLKDIGLTIITDVAKKPNGF